MRYWLLLLLMVNKVSAQFAIVNDKDGYVNVREAGDITSKVVDKLANQWLVIYGPEEKEWVSIEYNKGGKLKSGYVHASRLVFTTDIAGIKSLREIKRSGRQSVYKLDSVRVTVTIGPFAVKQHRITYIESEPPCNVEKIDGKYYWGKDSEIPDTEYKSIEVQWGGHTALMPAAGLSGVFQPDDALVDAWYDKAANRLYMEIVNGDGAGAYNCIWLWENGKYIDRLVWVP